MNLILGDCLEKLKELPDNSVDSIVTDPPYGISFMNSHWDYDVPTVEVWKECLRVLKHGGHLLSFAGTRTQHRMAVNIEDAGFEIRDMIAWIYGSGFPKSLNIGKAIDKKAGVERKVVGINQEWVDKSKKQIENGQSNINKNLQLKGYSDSQAGYQNPQKIGEITEPATEEAKKWDGWGTCLKPALEPITLARKPLKEKTIVENVLKHGTGGINIDECRVGDGIMENEPTGNKAGGNSLNMSKVGMPDGVNNTISTGRFPANVIHDGSGEVEEIFPETKSGTIKKGQPAGTTYGDFEWGGNERKTNREKHPVDIPANSGSASRFFYCPKASKNERDAGLGNFNDIDREEREKIYKNNHPTVKPVELMRYLVRLVTPKGGTVLDPYMGSGTTGIACKKERFDFIGIEREPDYLEIAKQRIESIVVKSTLF